MQGSDDERESGGRCPECGQAHQPGAKFCSECGARLASEPEREARKTVTAVFADVIGSTPLQERIDAEAAHHVMERFYQAMREVLEAHDGRVAKFIGDAVVAIFGVPAVREDDALRAVQAAGAMRDALGVLNDELERDWGVRIGMRVGVNTGEVVISAEGLAVGDAMNTAARLEQTAGSGEILIGETTFRHVRHAVQCEPVAPLTLKGKRDPVTAYLLVHAPATGGQQRARIEAPLIGRDPELARLLDVFEEVVREQTCRLVTVIGSPGLGKTRLAEELAAVVADRATVVQGRCEPTGEGITFLPVAEVLRGAAQIGEADEPAVVRSKLAALLPGDPDADLLVERAGGVLGIAKPATAEETFWSVRRLLGGLARERPLVVVLDDVHWGQPTFLDLVEHLVEWARQAPILILALARPELRDLRPALTEPEGCAAAVVELVPLADEHCRDLVSELLDRADVPEALATRVLQTTGGNPLFLGETLRMFVDDGVLRREGDGWVATLDAEAIDVPPTITALLAARIARLGADERSVVERASVIGKQFYRGAVADLAPPLVAAGIDGHLRALHRKEVVEPDGTTWIDEPVFRFHHVLIRDAAYRTLLKDARAELHERFADWLTDKAGELVGEHEEVIAFHLEQAYQYRRELGPLDDAGRSLGDRAVALLHATGRRALEREDLPAATNLLGRAAGVLDDASPGAADVVIDLLEALLSAGQTDDVAAVADRLRPLAGHGERPRAWATIATAQLAQLTGSTGLQDSLAEVASAGEALAAAGDDSGLAKAHHVRAQALALLGQVAEVEAALDQALAAARRGGDTRRATAVLSGAPRAALWGPSPVMRSSGRCLDVVRILRMSQGNRHVEAIALRCQAVLEAMRGRADAARQILDRCRMTLEELGLRLELLETEHYAGIVELVAGDHAAAEARLRTAHDGFALRGLDVGAAATAALLARALVEQGRDEEAEELTRFSEEHGRENLKTTIAWCGVRARVLARRGEHEEAEALANRAVALADGTDALVDHGDARLDLARVLRAAGEEERALTEARRAAELYEAKGHEVGAARAAAFAHEERHAPAPAVDADAFPKGLPAGRLVEWMRRLCTAIDQRDEDALRAIATDDVALFDRRPASPRGDTHDAEGYVRSIRALMDASDDLRSVYATFVDAGHLAMGLQQYFGHNNDGGGAFTLPMLTIGRLVGERMDHGELFLPEDERAALDGLLALHPDADERVAWSSVFDAMFAFNARDLEALGAPFVEAYTGLPEGRMSVEIVATAGADALMTRLWIDAATPVEGLGQVVSLRAGVAVGVELFDAGDAARMRARFAALGGPAVEPESAMERVYAANCAAFNARDWDAMRESCSEDLAIIDRRRMRVWPELRGLEAVLTWWMDLPSMAPDLRASVEILESDDESAVIRYVLRGHAIEGGGELEFEAFGISVLRDGRFCYTEFFDDDEDIAVPRARREELRPLARRRPGTGLPAEPLPVEHWLLRLMTEFDRAGRAGGWDDLPALLSPDLVTIDRRRVRTFAEEPSGGREAFIDREVSLAASTHDLRRPYVLLAASPTVTAVNVAVVGRMTDGDGPFEMSFSIVGEWRDGVLERVEFYDPEDEAVMLERFAELEAGAPAAQLRPSGMFDSFTRVSEAVNARDWPTLEAEFTADYLVIDRRLATGWVTMRGPAEVIATFQSFVAAAPDLETSFEILEGDEEVAIVHWTWRGHASEADGGGPFEDSFLMVYVVRDGLGLRNEPFSVDADLDELRAHAEKLRPLARRRPGIGLPDEPLVTERLAGAVVRALDDASRTGRWDAFRALLAPGFHSVDSRTLPTMNTGDAETYIAHEASLAASVHDVRRPYECFTAGVVSAAIICRVVGTLLDGDGPFDVPIGVVLELRGGLAARFQFFEPEDEAGMLARFAELEAGSPATRRSGAVFDLLTRASQSVNARDWPAVEAATADDFVHLNRKPATGWTPMRGPAEFVAMFQSFVAASPDLETSCENVEGDDEVAIVLWRWRGHMTEADGGGPYEDGEKCIVVVAGGRFVRSEAFTEDTSLTVLRARAKELRPLAYRRPGSELPDEPLPAERMVPALARAQEVADRTGDWDPVRAILAPALRSVDHRAVPTMNAGDAEEYIAIEASLAASARDMRLRLECIAAGSACCAVFCVQDGLLNDGDGAYELAVGIVLEVRDGLATSIEFFDADDEAGMLARFAELEAERPAGAVERALAGVRDAVYARDWSALGAWLAEDVLHVDRRPASGWTDLRGRDAMVEHFRTFPEVIPDIENDFEVVEGDDHVALAHWRWFGHAEDELGGGPLEDSAMIVFVVRDELVVYTELHPFDADRAPLLARAEALRPLAYRRPGSGLPDEPTPAERLTFAYPRVLDEAGRTGRWEDFRVLLDPGFQSIDHRPIPTLNASDADAYIAAEASLADSVRGDPRRPYECFAAGASCVAAICRVQGTLLDGGGPFEIAIGVLLGCRDDLVVRIEFFEPEDEAGMLARFAELEAEAPSGAALDVLAGIRDAANARDWDALGPRYAVDFLLIDRRPAAWSEVRGREAMVELFQSFTTLSLDVQAWFEPLADDDEVAVVRWGWGGHYPDADGGGAFEDALSIIFVVRDGAVVYTEHHPDEAHTEPAPLRARAEELRPLARRRPGADLPDEPLPTERLALRIFDTMQTASRTGDLQPLAALLATDCRIVDHRTFASYGEEIRSRDDLLATQQALAASSTDLTRHYEVLAANDTWTAGISRIRGWMVDGDGPFEKSDGIIMQWRDGLAVRGEMFDSEDEAGMLVRFAELEADGEPCAVETVIRRVCDASNARDWATLEAGFADDVILVDRRSIRAWEDVHGPAAMSELFRSFQTMLPNIVDCVDGVEGDDEVGVVQYSWRGRATDEDGGGPAEDAVAMVCVVRDGRSLYGEVFEPETDVEQLRARAEELRPLARRRPGAGLPTEPLRTERSGLRLFDAIEAAGRTGGWDDVATLLAADFSLGDHRLASVFGDDVRDREALIDTQRSLAASSFDVTRRYEVVAASDRLTLGVETTRGRLTDGGGPFELLIGILIEWRAGVAVRAELFEPEDEAAMLARFRELEATSPASVTHEVLARVRDVYNAHDWTALGACFAEDFLMVDRRLAAWSEIRGRDGVVEHFRSFTGLIPDVQASFDHLDSDDEVAIVRWWWRGHADDEHGGGPAEDVVMMILVARDGVSAYVEVYPPDTDVKSLRPRAEELRPLARRRCRAGLPDEPLPAERWTVRYWAEMDEAGRTGRWETFRELLVPDFAAVDHRLASMSAMNDREAYIAFEMSLATSSRDLCRSWELVAASDTATAMIGTARGHMSDGGGPFELHLGLVLGWRDGVAVRIEAFDAADEAALLARFHELS